MPERDTVLDSLDGKSPALFLLAGALLVVFAGVNIAQALTDPAAYENLHGTFGPAGFVFAFLGLLGLYPTLADRSPRLARAGAVCAALGVVGFSVLAVSSLAALAGVIPGEPPAWLPVFLLLAVVGMVPGFLSFAAAVLRTDVRSRTLGLLLAVPPITFFVMMVGGVVLSGNPWGAVVISSTQALAHLAIGYTLRTRGVPTDRAESPVDATA